MAGQIIKRDQKGKNSKKGKPTWLVRIYLGRDAQGKREYLNKTIHGTKEDARKWLTEQLRNRDMGVVIEPAAGTLNTYLDRWLKEAAEPKVRRKTYAGYVQMLKRYVRPAIGSRPFVKIKPLEIQALYNSMREQELSPRTIRYTHVILKRAFKQAVHWRMLTFNPCDGVQLPRQQRKEMQVLSPDQVRKFLAASKADRYAAVFELAITSGMRPSEYLSLKWSDVDLIRGAASVNRSLDWLPGGGWEFAENKTGRSRRVVKLHGSVVLALRDWKPVQDQDRERAGKNWTEHGLVFTTETGGPLDRHNLARRNFREILKAAKLPQIRLYDLRHTAATLALSAGVPVKVVSEQLGHASAALTLDVYSHVLPHMQEEAVQKVEKLILGEVAVSATPERKRHGKRHTIGTQNARR